MITFDLRYLLIILVLNFSLSVVAQLPDFHVELIVEGFASPTSAVILPDNRMLIAQLNGNVLITSNLDQEPVTTKRYLQLVDINGSAEHGLLSIILDPDFTNNNQFYLYYSTLSNYKNRISRFTHLGDTAFVSDETVIWETTNSYADCCHVGGAMHFLADGTLFISIGDDFTPALAQSLDNDFGKLHRINPDGSIPLDNPFYDTTPGPYNANGELKSIYAFGLRNPFRGAYDQLHDRYWIGEVGGNDHSVAWEDVHEAAAGVNYGWPFCGQTGREPDGSCTEPLYIDPIFTYSHANIAASITAGLFYGGTMFPAEYQGRFFYADYVRNWIRYLDFDVNGAIIDDQPFMDQSLLGGEDPLTVVNMLEGQNGEIYYLSLFNDFQNYTGGVYKIQYELQMGPVCTASTATPSSGPGPSLQVQFNASATDVNNDSLTYTWEMGDGSPILTGQNPQHNYTAPGLYYAQVEISDGDSTQTCPVVEINVGIKMFLDVQLFLEGPLDTVLMLMDDDLRVAGSIPTEEPYTALGFEQAGQGGGEEVLPAVLNVSGNDAIVDWVLVELRDEQNPAEILQTRTALLQRDGDIVELDGINPLYFYVNERPYYLAIRHRNHLACMTFDLVELIANDTIAIDLTDGSTATFGVNAQISTSGEFALWAGNCSLDDQLNYVGVENDRDEILLRIGGVVPTLIVSGYYQEDANLDGKVKYAGKDNDRDIILRNIGGGQVTNSRQEQLP